MISLMGLVQGRKKTMELPADDVSLKSRTLPGFETAVTNLTKTYRINFF
jgi:hypothetical protein